jgi:hypothetical protein
MRSLLSLVPSIEKYGQSGHPILGSKSASLNLSTNIF